ncbi:MAG: hypothetical protein ACREEK_12860 [Bradyrhizobium sp.]
MPLAYLPEIDPGRRLPISPGLRRALVFAWLGPVFGIVTAWYGMPIVFFFSLIVCAIAGPVDGVLADGVPIWLRAPLIALVGAAVAVGLGLYLWIALGSRMAPPSLDAQISIAVLGAVCTGACSLLSHDYGRSHL